LAQAKVEVSPTSKAWEPQRAYEKRLAAIMAKDKVPGAKGRKAKTSKGEGDASSEDETDLSEVEKLVEEHDIPPPEPARPRPRPKRLPKKAAEKILEDEDQSGPPSPELVTPRPRKTYQSKSASKSPTKPPAKPSKEVDALSPARSESPDGVAATPVNKKSQKRPRPEDEEEEQDDSANGSAIAEDHVLGREATPAGDMQIRRKRARH